MSSSDIITKGLRRLSRGGRLFGPLLGLAFLIYPIRAVLTSDPTPLRVLFALLGAALFAGILWLVLPTVVLGLWATAFVRQVATVAELRAAREEIARLAVTEERLRFARDLHDLLGHSLSLITLKSELASRLLPAAPEKAAAEVRDIESVARRALRDVREAVAGYRQPTLDGELSGAREMLEAARLAEQKGWL